jgi:hypothetical protein
MQNKNKTVAQKKNSFYSCTRGVASTSSGLTQMLPSRHAVTTTPLAGGPVERSRIPSWPSADGGVSNV